MIWIIIIVGIIGALFLVPNVRGALQNLTEDFTKPKRILSPDEIESVIQSFAPKVKEKFRQGWIDAARIAAQSRQLPITEDVLQCNKAGGMSTGQFISAGGGVLAGLLPASVAVPILAPVGIFASIFGAHEQAVKNEQNVLCSAVPSANQAIQQIKEAEISGQFSRSEAIAAYKDVLSQFKNVTSPITKDSGKTCNAGCGFNRMLSVIVSIEVSELQG